MRNRSRALPLVVALLGLTPPVSAAERGQTPSLEARLARVERLLESQALVDMLTRLDSLQRELQQLRGEVERQVYLVEGVKERQRDLYLDIDRRLSRMEREGTASVAPDSGMEGNATASIVPTAKQGLASPPVRPVSTASQAAKPDGAKGSGPAPAATASGDLARERDAYQQAFNLLRELRYDQAIEAFGEFLKSYPDGRYGHIAQYWLGEANYARRNFKAAIAAYEQLIARFPKSPKLAEAMLKIGYSRYELGDKAKAQQVLSQLVERYPGTTEAGQAQNMLLKMRRETS